MERGREKVYQELPATVSAKVITKAQFTELQGRYEIPKIIIIGQSIKFGQFRELIFQSRVSYTNTISSN